MSYTHIHLPELEILKKQIESNPDSIKYYLKYMGFAGPTNSVDYLIRKINEHCKN